MDEVIYVCPHCKSEKIQQKAWIEINKYSKNHLSQFVELIDSDEAEDFWCMECEQHIIPETK